jgi:hypothetical protein
MKLSAITFALVGLVPIFGFGQAPAQSNPDALKSGFENPPQSWIRRRLSIIASPI